MALAALVLLAASPAAGGDAGSREPSAAFPRAAMQEIFSALVFALPRSMDPHRFGDPNERERILAALGALSDRAGQLEIHGAARGEGFRYLAAALARDALDVRSRYEAGRIDEAAFLLQRITEDCLACHARLPSSGDAALSARLAERIPLEELDRPERARLLAATRQFEAALDTWEELFFDPDVPLARHDRMGYFADYLTVAIRVQGDLARALATLRRLAARPDVPDWVTPDFAAYIAALEELHERGLGDGDGSALGRARSLIAEAEALRDVPADRTGLVQDLVASSLLYRFTESRPWKGRDVAEAYYWLGVAESRIDRSYWRSQADFYLETAIRMAPREPFARDAYARLAERTRAGYTGSSGTHVPPDVQRRLDELRALVGG